MNSQMAGRIKRYRESLKLNQREAADAAGLSQAMWSRIESGDKEPTLGQLSAIAVALGCPLESLTETNPVRERLRFAARKNKKTLTTEEQAALDAAKERIAFMMEVNAHLRYIGVGVHHARA